MNLVDVIKQCDDGKPHVRDLAAIVTLAIHRIGLGNDPIEVCRRFREDPEVAKYTGAENPYTFYVGPAGEIWQALPISDIGRHARRWNVQAIGIGVMGDFRKQAAPVAQVAALDRLCFELITALDIPADQVKGHDELPGGSSDASKQCPGKHLSMTQLRDRLRSMQSVEERAQRLRTAGFIV